MRKRVQKGAAKIGIGAPLVRAFAPLNRPMVARYGVLAAAIFGFWPSRAVAQGCAMCYQNAAASGAAGRAALQHGILILLIPAATLFLGLLSILRRSNRRTQPHG